jgi:NAD(P)-dependent dehydrogenase (short-subunit alcohol dehydrogenase family)
MSSNNDLTSTDDNPYRLSDEDLETRVSHMAPGLLKDQVVLVSGGGSGIGRSTAWLAARLGAHVIVAGKTMEKLDAVCKPLTDLGFKCDAISVNIRDRHSVDELFSKIKTEFGRLDILVNSAGGQFPQAAIDFSEGGWNAVVDTNLTGTFHMMQAAARLWKDLNVSGSIVNLVTVNRGLHGVSHSVAARAGVIAFSECVSIEWAPLNIRVNCVAPGTIQTEGWVTYSEEARQTYPKTNPMMKVSNPWNVAHSCLFVGGPMGEFMTGETLVVDGGGRHWGQIWTTGRPDYFSVDDEDA